MTKIQIYCDSGADISKLKNVALWCEFYQFPYDSPDRPKKPLLLAKPSAAQWRYRHAAWKEFHEITWDDFKGSSLHPQIEAIMGIGPEKRRDVLHFDSAYKTGCKLFLTSDKGDIWSKRAALESLTGIKSFFTAFELEEFLEYFNQLITREMLFEEAERYILAHHVSLGDSPGNPNLVSPPPSGSGTFVKFTIQEGMVVYGILTAAHVARWLRFGKNDNRQFLGLSKLQKGDTVACSVTFPFIYHVASIEHFHSTSGDGYQPDIAFIALGINECLPSHELIADSSFYDLDSNQELELYICQVFSAFYKGAGEIRPDGLINTFVAFGGGEILKFDEKIGVQYWRVPNTSGESIAGGSGAGFWRLIYNNGVLRKSLEGVITAEDRNYEYFEAIATSYLYDTFLPQLKKFCTRNRSWFP